MPGSTQSVHVPVLIVGGGPTGLVLSIELGQKGVASLVVEQNPGTTTFPKANLTSARSMEHYRRLGFSREFRKMGLPEDYPQDVSFWTRYSTHEIARLKVPSSREALAMDTAQRGNWMTPELPHRAQQMAFEVLLRREAERLSEVDLRYGWRLTGFEDCGSNVLSTIENVETGESVSISSDFLVGCDGPRSFVRQSLGIRYQGDGSADREFFGGKMLAMHFRCPELYRLINGPLAWHYWTVNKERRALLVSLDGKGTFVVHVQLPKGVEATEALGRQWVNQAAGTEVPMEILKVLEWTAGYTLVAEHYGKGRVLIAGDAAHLFTPAAGLGYNTSIDDVANLGWKLAAVIQGWGGPALLASYEEERKPIGERNTRFARSTANNIGDIPFGDALEEDSASGEAERAKVGARIYDILVKEFEIPGVILGVCYRGSRLVATEEGPPPEDDMHVYRPSTYPGCRAPHLVLDDGGSILDRFGKGFVLVGFNGKASDATGLCKAAQAAGLPLAVEMIHESAARELYGSDWVLVRPDQHVAWRGDSLPRNPAALIDRIRGAL
jgi:2-polyprenyl-6-methoxyphenol hydroxylase-like FAD-dependent oxidoreductase